MTVCKWSGGHCRRDTKGRIDGGACSRVCLFDTESFAMLAASAESGEEGEETHVWRWVEKENKERRMDSYFISRAEM